MTTIQSSALGSSLGAAAVRAAPSAPDIQDRFLKLLIAQMKNQDPLNPLDNAQITTQLAQISTVNGIQQLNTTMQSLSDSLLSSQSLQSAGLIGRNVVIDGNSFALSAGTPATGGIELDGSADSVKVLITGPAGDVVRQLELGPQSAGLLGFQWDGLRDNGASAVSGQYTFEVIAKSSGTQVDATTFVGGKVNSVTLGADGPHLAVDGVGDIPMQQVKSIL